MNTKLLRLGAGIVALLLIGLAARHYLLNPPEAPIAALSTQALFAASFPDANGNLQTLKQWQGKIAVINFWATWCAPCREEMPELSRLQDQYRDRGLVVLGISADDVPTLREFAKKTPVSYPLLAAEMAAMDVGVSLGNNRSVLPYTVIIQADGSIAKTFFGRVNQALLEETLLRNL